jgi:hypothetical protein
LVARVEFYDNKPALMVNDDAGDVFHAAHSTRARKSPASDAGTI